MRAAVGDWLRMGGRIAGQPQRRGQIIEIRGVGGEPPYLVRFSDGRTSLVIPGPGAVIEHRRSVQVMGRGAARSGDEAAPGLMFRMSGSQHRALLITAAVVTLAAALAGAAAVVANPSGLMTALAAGAGIVALIALYYSVAYAVAYTECLPAGLRVRGVAGRRFLPWVRLRDIAVRDYGSSPYRAGPSKPLRIVIVTADDGTRFWLGAPIDGGQCLGDPEFEDKVRQISDYWRSMRSRGVAPAARAGRDPTGSPRASQAGSVIRADPVPGQALNAFIARVWRAAFVIVAILLAVAGFPITLRDAGPAWSAYLGHGQHGTFTAQGRGCPAGCRWYGYFVADNGAVENRVMLADGGAISRKGDVVPAVDIGRRGMVYPVGSGTALYPVIGLLLVEISPAAYLLIRLTRELLRRRRTPRRPGRSLPGLSAR